MTEVDLEDENRRLTRRVQELERELAAAQSELRARDAGFPPLGGRTAGWS